MNDRRTFTPEAEKRIRAILNRIAKEFSIPNDTKTEDDEQLTSIGGVKSHIHIYYGENRTPKRIRMLIATPDRLFFEVWSRPITRIAAEIGMSDRAISKRCKREKVPCPPNGYWAKIESGIPHVDALVQFGWTLAEIEDIGRRKFAPERIQTGNSSN